MVKYSAALPAPAKFQKALRAQRIILIFDKKLLDFAAAAEWIEGFENRIAVTAGEKLKTFESAQALLPQLLETMAGSSRQKTVFVALGGGSVGDFVGFMASVVKRGVRLVHVPSTWLAAIDSAHGGKTALNVGDYKNQIGTFKQAEQILIVRELLALQGENEMRAAMGELIKIALLDSGRLFSRLEKISTPTVEKVWPLLPMAVEAKYRVVKKDPYEEKGLRHILNLGHTLGHAFELSEGLAHGAAVSEGTRFALEFSHSLKLLKIKDLERVRKLIGRLGPQIKTRALPVQKLRSLLLNDKKASGNSKLRFVLLKKVGQPTLKEILIDDIVAEALRQGVAQ